MPEQPRRDRTDAVVPPQITISDLAAAVQAHSAAVMGYTADVQELAARSRETIGRTRTVIARLSPGSGAPHMVRYVFRKAHQISDFVGFGSS